MSRAMKDSGIPWIGQVPEHWKLKKAKNIFSLRKVKGDSDDILLAATQKFGMIPQSLVEGVVQVKMDTDFNTFKAVYINDFVISLRSFQGGFEISDYKGVCSPAYQVFFNKIEISHQFYKYLFKCYGFISQINAFTVGIREGRNIQYADFSLMYLPFPDVKMQRTIADFLDVKCAEVDELIALQGKMIEELKLYKQSVITEAVTNGLNPDAPLKDSGIEWIGQIPQHWSIERLKFYAKSKYDRNQESLECDYIGLENIVSYSLSFIKSSSEYDKSQSILCNAGDVIFGKLRPYLAKVFLVDKTISCSSEFAVFTAVSSPEYLKYLLISDWFIKIVDASTYGTKMPRANIDFIKNMDITIPPIGEQQQIAEYLDKKCAEIDEMTSIKQKKIEQLKEYKKSIIYEYVTGKKQVNIE